ESLCVQSTPSWVRLAATPLDSSSPAGRYVGGCTMLHASASSPLGPHAARVTASPSRAHRPMAPPRLRFIPVPSRVLPGGSRHLTPGPTPAGSPDLREEWRIALPGAPGRGSG